ncbi:hypothetical protein Patl1_07133 [Pistacia atlantica]|uniref:Uncharacterized protein n=1 Tax=Pistacia atlantica TaxID=434234 RepID=A0ACC1AIX5_9ROSI|nr:hypothetical protein Patl1_07133 [Pistacia atlantica]
MPQEQEDEEVGKLAIRLANASILPMVMNSAIGLNLIDIISAASGDGTFLSPSDVATMIYSNARLELERMGEVERLYGSAPICKFFVKNEDGGSLGPLLQLQQDEVTIQSCYHLTNSVLEGGTPFNRAYGMRSEFEYIEMDPNHGQLLNKAMSSNTTLIMKKMVDVYKGFKMKASKCINFDLPHVVAHAPPKSGVEHVGGDMFTSVPKGDAIFLKTVLHNWDDEDCLKLLKNCCEALPNCGKVIIIELIVPETPENNVSSNIVSEKDLLMMVVHPGGRERTLKEYETLAVKSGFSRCDVTC